MGKRGNGRTDKEYTKVQRLSHENKHLKKEISKLRGTLDRMDHGWCPGCIGANDDKDYTPEPRPKESGENEAPSLAKGARVCFKCESADLILIKYDKANGETFYFRRCPACGHRTIGKKYTQKVRD